MSRSEAEPHGRRSEAQPRQERMSVMPSSYLRVVLVWLAVLAALFLLQVSFS